MNQNRPEEHEEADLSSQRVQKTEAQASDTFPSQRSSMRSQGYTETVGLVKNLKKTKLFFLKSPKEANTRKK